MADARLTIVSNRLPVTVSTRGGRTRVTPSSGGLATGLRGAHERGSGRWIGWPGDTSTLTPEQLERLRAELERQRLVPIELSADDVRLYYTGFSNGVVWPLFHYLLDRGPIEGADWDAYTRVNRTFADAALPSARDGDLVWVHDYHLMLVPEMIREQVPDARIGFFLHIPFPAFDVFRLLPWRAEILQGLLGADLVGFHTSSYSRHFAIALRHLLDVEISGDHAWFRGRPVRVGTFPMGVDVERFETLAASSAVELRLATIRRDAGSRQLLVGVDRLDYTKGIPRRLLAFERFLARHPERHDAVRFIQVAVPSRGEVGEYRAFRRTVNEIVGRINSTASTLGSVPVHYLHRSVSDETLAALYRAAAVMLVTPLRDGMNLVAKEFVATRVDEDGVLILSEFAGAADELGDALIVNPYDIDGLADAIETALAMPLEERRTRMHSLRQRVAACTVHDWVSGFVAELELQSRTATHVPAVLTAERMAHLASELQRASRLAILVDYDGTLVRVEDTPELARPDAALIRLLDQLARCRNVDVHIVSGRGRTALEEWLGRLPVTLWAEHALWRRDATQAEWRAAFAQDRAWKNTVRDLMKRASGRTPGSLVEDKGDSLAWHYRLSDPLYAEEEAARLKAAIADAFPHGEIEPVGGRKVVEARPHGAQKGLAVAAVRAETPEARILAIGDDRTDEDMFATTLAGGGVAVSVGDHDSRARLHVTGTADVRRLLEIIRRTCESEATELNETVARESG
jgi:trehalose 6-phosphate synthase/phosphatase